MHDRRRIKYEARRHVSRHYFLLTALCAISVFFGTEFTNVVNNAQIFYDALTGRATVLDTIGTTTDQITDSILLDDYIEDNLRAGRENAAARLQELKSSAGEHSVLGRQKGILAAMMNNLNSGQLTVTLGLALHSIIHSEKITAVIMILGGFALTALIWVFVRNMYRAILRRAMLETRTYDTLPMSHLYYFKTVCRWTRASLTLLRMSVQEWLWMLTVVGGVIKHYAYFLVPFITAENPDIRPAEAIALSRRMMDGHKWECFWLDLSFLGWRLLGFVTFGTTEILWSVPYRVAAFTEYYALLRSEAKEKQLPGAEMLNDDALFVPAEEELLRRHYADIIAREDLIDEDIVVLSPVRRFLAANFGIWAASIEEKKVYSRQEGLRQQMRLGRTELYGKAYPQRLSPLWRKEAAALTGKVSYLSPSTPWALIIIFFVFCLIGWLWEVSLHLVADGVFVNRGFMHGPWLPIYGSGVLMISVMLFRFRRNPALEAAAVVVLCGIVEYATSAVMEQALGMRWWDYTGYYLNLNGRICAEGLAVFALGGLASVYFLVPVISAAADRVKPAVLITVCIVLLTCFTADLLYTRVHPNTGRGITDYGQTEQMPPAEEQMNGLLADMYGVG